ncbi:MAG: FAD:protein FMN transferase [Pelosinus sp.]|nr:FAD:protein FMN transferase [Pelosinus sp.]
MTVVLFVIFAVVTGGCAIQNLFAPKPYTETQFLMDTVIEITAYGPQAEAGVKEVFAEIKHLHDITNNFDENSEVSQISRQAGLTQVAVDPELVAIIKLSNQLSDKLDSVFDITIGPLTELWGVGHKGEFVPTQAEIDKACALVNYKLIQLDETNHTVFLPSAGMKLDLGGIAKGYAVDRAIDILKSKGIKSALINAGGDVRVIGKKPDGSPWRIGVQDPRSSEGMIAALPLTIWDNMETSGDYQRFFLKDGERYSHILDPRTGRQPRSITSVTIVGSRSGDDDVLSTVLFIVGAERGRELLKQFPGTEAVFVTNEGKILVTPGLEGIIEIQK